MTLGRAFNPPPPNPAASGNSYSSASREPGLGLVVVVPAHHRRQRHQDRLDAAARLQAEQRAAVVEQVELDVAAAAELLEGPLLARCTARPCGGGRSAGTRRGNASPQSRTKAKSALEVAFEVVEEDAADAARLAAVRQEEVLVAPLLEARVVDRRRVPVADRLPGRGGSGSRPRGTGSTASGRRRRRTTACRPW